LRCFITARRKMNEPVYPPTFGCAMAMSTLSVVKSLIVLPSWQHFRPKDSKRDASWWNYSLSSSPPALPTYSGMKRQSRPASRTATEVGFYLVQSRPLSSSTSRILAHLGSVKNLLSMVPCQPGWGIFPLGSPKSHPRGATVARSPSPVSDGGGADVASWIPG